MYSCTIVNKSFYLLASTLALSNDFQVGRLLISPVHLLIQVSISLKVEQIFSLLRQVYTFSRQDCSSPVNSAVIFSSSRIIQCNIN